MLEREYQCASARSMSGHGRLGEALLRPDRPLFVEVASLAANEQSDDSRNCAREIPHVRGKSRVKILTDRANFFLIVPQIRGGQGRSFGEAVSRLVTRLLGS
jgi:hypothetical protein